jgi:ribosome-associated protein
MSRKPKKGYFVRGHFVAAGSELDQQLQRELRGSEDPSKTELKAQSTELQELGEALLTLRADLRAKVTVPDRLLDAVAELGRISSFEGKRRQRQFIGKLMRKLTDEEVQSIREALDIQRQGSAADAATLHAAEHWRERLVADDGAVTDWLAQFPATDTQQLRALVRQARKDHIAPDARAVSEGQAPRQGRAFRELFQLVREHMQQAREAETAGDAGHGASGDGADD